jgi:hypothetical protein
MFGQTQVAYPAFGLREAVPFNHPLDLHFAEPGIQVGMATERCAVLYCAVLSCVVLCCVISSGKRDGFKIILTLFYYFYLCIFIRCVCVCPALLCSDL